MNDTVVLHANWTASALVIWGESRRMWSERRSAQDGAHPFAPSAADVARVLGAIGLEGTPTQITLRLPMSDGTVLESARLAHATGHGSQAPGPLALGAVRLDAIRFEPADAGAVLDRLGELGSRASIEGDEVHAGRTIEYFCVVLRLARHLLAQQRFVPSLRYGAEGPLSGLWQAWLGDEPTGERLAALIDGAPAAAFCVCDEAEHDPVAILEDFLSRIVDASCRHALTLEQMEETIEDIEPESDEHVGWLSGLLREEDRVRSLRGGELVRGVRRWISRLEDRGASTSWCLLLRLEEPDDESALAKIDAGEQVDPEWRLSFHLQSVDAPDIVVLGEEIWLLTGDAANIEGRLLERPHELFLGELGRAARLYPALERALAEAEPTSMMLSTKEAYRFLREARPVLQEQGVSVDAPVWWDTPSARVAARLRVEAPEIEALFGIGEGHEGAGSSVTSMGLASLVDFDWEITLGGATLTLGEFEELAARKTPLIRVNGHWVEVRPEDVRSAVEFMRANPGGKMPLTQAIRLAYASDERETGIPVLGLSSTGWVDALLGASTDEERLPLLDQPKGLHGELRPYQRRGLSWLMFLERFGLGPCLADDMGLGKTIQVLALLQHERELAGGLPPAPTLIVVPMSVVGNWLREGTKFCPELAMTVHHGPERAQGDAFERQARASDAVITTYSLAHRDRESLEKLAWRRIVLDEAQFIKNPRAKQSIAVRSLSAERRVALTGTPVENRLSELWSIMEFLNPSYLGSSQSFARRFAVPIERYHDEERSRQLRGLIQPFVLRRLKTDPNVLSELPEKFESRQYAHLTPEQAGLYETYVKRMLGQIDQVEGMRRRGLVLATLVRLKQICNHPTQVLKDLDDAVAPDPSRSGKCVRLLEILEEVIAENDQALVFTQFRQMGLLLASMLRHELDREILVLHGGLTKTQREQVVDRFQSAGAAAPVMVASLKAGGIGLNLTAATHVVHFDRWWNPAVENQATDRAYRIGQTKAVQVHKFVVRGTLEERIDQMIEEKTGLAERIVGAGERWLTELDTSQLRSLLTLRHDAVGDEE